MTCTPIIYACKSHLPSIINDQEARHHSALLEAGQTVLQSLRPYGRFQRYAKLHLFSTHHSIPPGCPSQRQCYRMHPRCTSQKGPPRAATPFHGEAMKFRTAVPLLQRRALPARRGYSLLTDTQLRARLCPQQLLIHSPSEVPDRLRWLYHCTKATRFQTMLKPNDTNGEPVRLGSSCIMHSARVIVDCDSLQSFTIIRSMLACWVPQL
eukprot:349801-Chlamydomonas_euryale.AAC.10